MDQDIRTDKGSMGSEEIKGRGKPKAAWRKCHQKYQRAERHECGSQDGSGERLVIVENPCRRGRGEVREGRLGGQGVFEVY